MEFIERFRELYKKYDKKPKVLSEKEKEIKLEQLLEIATKRYMREELNERGEYYSNGLGRYKGSQNY